MLASAGFGLACRTGPGGREELSLDVTAERYVRLTLQLAQHQPSLVDAWLGPTSWQPGPRRPVAEIRADIAVVQRAMDTTGANDNANPRWLYLQRQIASLDLAARRLSGETMRFADEARRAFGDPIEQLLADAKNSAGGLAAARAELDGRLPGHGPLHERYASFRQAHAIAPERLSAALRRAVDYCRARVRAQVALPDEESVHLEAAREIGFEGWASYEGRFRTRVQIDTTGPLDLARVIWLVAHETYPGHHLQHVLCDRDLVLAGAWSERALYPAFGWHLLLAEGTAEAGAALLLAGSQFSDACHAVAEAAGIPSRTIDDLVAVHRAVADADLAVAGVAEAYLDDTLDAASAAEALTTHAFVPDARQFLAAIERERTRILSYPIGRRLVSAHLFRLPPDRRWAQLAQIASTLVLPI